MLGRTHYKLGIGYYLIFLPITITIFAVNKIDQLLIGILISAVAGLLPDIDMPNSKVNTQNIITAMPIKFIDKSTKVLLYILRCGICLIAAYLLWENSKGQADTYKTIFQGLAFMLAFFGLLGGQIIKKLPLYKRLENSAINFGGRLKKTVVTVFVILLVAAGYIYNFNTYNDWVIYLFGVVLIASTLFPHRTFTHSLEGFLLYSYFAYYLASLLGYKHLGIAFIVGNMSHLYLADLFTTNGIPLSFIPYILKATGIHRKMQRKENKIYNAVYKLLSTRLRISLIKTGSKWEAIYSTVVLIIAAYILQRSFM